MKTHIRDIRLYNNSGISFPVCCAGAEFLDLNKTGWTFASGIRETDNVTCKNCLKIFYKRYPWGKNGILMSNDVGIS